MYLQLNSISKIFGDTKKETLQDVSLEVDRNRTQTPDQDRTKNLTFKWV